MTIADRIKSAEASRDEAFRNNSISGVSYWDGYIDALKAVEGEKLLIKPGRYEQIPLEECHKYACCINCIHFAMTGMSAPDGSCTKTKRSVGAYRHCGKFEEKRDEQR
jgi:hypothetical protein